MPAPSAVSAAATSSDWFARDEHGATRERTRTCECGRAFKQFLLSERFCALCERRGITAMVEAQIPGGYVPVHCPRCERVDIGRRARLDAAQYPPDYTERHEAAD